MATTTAKEMADDSGVNPKLFRQALGMRNSRGTPTMIAGQWNRQPSARGDGAYFEEACRVNQFCQIEYVSRDSDVGMLRPTYLGPSHEAD
jgi:hypothetical protein